MIEASFRSGKSRRLGSLLILFVLIGCQSNPVEESHNVGNTILVGTWAWTTGIDNCTEIYRYYDDGTYAVISGREIASGRYSVSMAPNESGRYVLTRTTLVDHGGTDCANNSEDNTGSSSTLYLQFDATQNAVFKMYHPTKNSGFGPLLRFRASP